MSGRRALLGVCVGLLLAAAALWGAATLVWFRVTAQVPLRGPVPAEFTGAQAQPSLTGVALLALAGVAAVVALSGVLRRLLGLLLAAAGALVAATALTAYGRSPFATDGAVPTPPAGIPADAVRHQPVDVSAAPALAVAAGLVLLAAGGLVLVRERALPRFGARYAAPAARPAPVDPDRAAWQDLDAGRDPTVGGPLPADPPPDQHGDGGRTRGDGTGRTDGGASGAAV